MKSQLTLAFVLLNGLLIAVLVNGDLKCFYDDKTPCERSEFGDMCKKLGEKFYLIYTKKPPVTWLQAFMFCRSQDGFLVTIQNEKELNLITPHLHDQWDYWIGITRLDAEGFYASETGKASPFLKWSSSPQQPDNWDGDEKCVELSQKGMNDNSCSRLRSFICELK